MGRVVEIGPAHRNGYSTRLSDPFNWTVPATDTPFDGHSPDDAGARHPPPATLRHTTPGGLLRSVDEQGALPMQVSTTGNTLPKGMLSVVGTYRGWGSAAHIESAGLAVAPDQAAGITVFGKNGLLHDTSHVSLTKPQPLSGSNAELAADLLKGYAALADQFGEQHVSSAAAAVDPHANYGVALIRTDDQGHNFVLKAPRSDANDDSVNRLVRLSRTLATAAGIDIPDLSWGA